MKKGDPEGKKRGREKERDEKQRNKIKFHTPLLYPEQINRKPWQKGTTIGLRMIGWSFPNSAQLLM